MDRYTQHQRAPPRYPQSYSQPDQQLHARRPGALPAGLRSSEAPGLVLFAGRMWGSGEGGFLESGQRSRGPGRAQPSGAAFASASSKWPPLEDGASFGRAPGSGPSSVAAAAAPAARSSRVRAPHRAARALQVAAEGCLTPGSALGGSVLLTILMPLSQLSKVPYVPRRNWSFPASSLPRQVRWKQSKKASGSSPEPLGRTGVGAEQPPHAWPFRQVQARPQNLL